MTWKPRLPAWIERYPRRGRMTVNRMAEALFRRYPDLFEDRAHAKKVVTAFYEVLRDTLLEDRLVIVAEWAYMGLRVWKGRSMKLRTAFNKHLLKEKRERVYVDDRLCLAVMARKPFRDRLRGLKNWRNL